MVAITIPQKFGTGFAPSGSSPSAYDTAQNPIIVTAAYAQATEPMASMRPSMMPPTTAPARLPMPPNTAAVKALMPGRKPIACCAMP